MEPVLAPNRVPQCRVTAEGSPLLHERPGPCGLQGGEIGPWRCPGAECDGLEPGLRARHGLDGRRAAWWAWPLAVVVLAVWDDPEPAGGVIAGCH